MVEVSRDGRRVYFTNSLYGAIDPQFYPDGIADGEARRGARRRHPARSKFFITWPDGYLPHRAAPGGDASSDSYCYP